MVSEHNYCKYVSDATSKEWIPCDPDVYSRLRVCGEKISQIESNNLPCRKRIIFLKTTKNGKRNSSEAASTYHAPPRNSARRKINEVHYPALSRSKPYIKTPGTL